MYRLKLRLQITTLTLLVNFLGLFTCLKQVVDTLEYKLLDQYILLLEDITKLGKR